MKAEKVTVIEAKPSSAMNTGMAVAVWLCGIHLNLAGLLAAFLFFPVSKAAMVVILLYVFLIGVPVHEKGKFQQKLARYVCQHACGYFPITVHVEDYQSFNANRAYVFGFEPHSAVPLVMVALTTYAGYIPFLKIKVLASNAVFYIPIIRHIWTWMGLSPATRKNFKSLLASGCSCLIIPGGIRESFYTERDSEVIFLRNRKGFVRLAIEMGTPLVPVFCFGQTKAYNWWIPCSRLLSPLFRLMKLTPMLLWGKFGSPLPIRHPIHVVVGKPIEINKNSRPSTDEVNKVHDRFLEAMEELFERHKARVGYADLQLTIL